MWNFHDDGRVDKNKELRKNKSHIKRFFMKPWRSLRWDTQGPYIIFRRYFNMKVNVCNIFTAMPNLLQRREGCSLKQQFSDFIPVYQAVEPRNSYQFLHLHARLFLKDPFWDANWLRGSYRVGQEPHTIPIVPYYNHLQLWNATLP